jgi:hypothetical protein
MYIYIYIDVFRRIHNCKSTCGYVYIHMYKAKLVEKKSGRRSWASAALLKTFRNRQLLPWFYKIESIYIYIYS